MEERVLETDIFAKKLDYIKTLSEFSKDEYNIIRYYSLLAAGDALIYTIPQGRTLFLTGLFISSNGGGVYLDDASDQNVLAYSLHAGSVFIPFNLLKIDEKREIRLFCDAGKTISVTIFGFEVEKSRSL